MQIFQKILLIPVILGALLGPISKTIAGEGGLAPQKVAILVSKPRHVRGVLKMLEEMKADKNKIQYTEAKIVLHGKAVHEVKKGSSLRDHIKKAKENNVTVAVCNVAITRLKIKREELLPLVEIVDNAFYEMLRLKSLGFNALEL